MVHRGRDAWKGSEKIETGGGGAATDCYGLVKIRNRDRGRDSETDTRQGTRPVYAQESVPRVRRAASPRRVPRAKRNKFQATAGT